jgi:tRNA A-37 threonylcarbamoyl transferase component Bud32
LLTSDIEADDDITEVSQRDVRAATPDLIGTLVAGRYRILDLIGAGGMGRVYLAEHVAIRKKFALKVLGNNFVGNQEFVDRFLQEARAASSVDHRNVVEITDFGSTPDNVPFFVMEYLEGEELSATVKREGALAWPRVRTYMLQLLAGLEAAHAKGVIHRDVKPHNCFLVNKPRHGSSHGSSHGGFIKVLDFGIAKVVTDDADYRTLTPMGALMGTAHYMAPEQARSEPIDERADIYAAGVIAFELLTGDVPYRARGVMGVVSKVLTQEIPAMADINAEVAVHPTIEAVVRRAMAKDRGDRYASAAEFAAALSKLSPELGAVAAVNDRVWALIVGGSLLALMVAAAMLLGRGNDDVAVEPVRVAVNQPEQTPAPAEPGRALDQLDQLTAEDPHQPLDPIQPVALANTNDTDNPDDTDMPAPDVKAQTPPAPKPKQQAGPKPEPDNQGPTPKYDVVIDVRKRCELEIDGIGVGCNQGQLLRLESGTHELRWRFLGEAGGAWLTRKLAVQPGPKRCLLLFSDNYQLSAKACLGAGG